MDSRSDSFVSGCLASVLRLSRFIGIAPLRFVKTRSGWRISLCSCLSIYGHVMITTLNFITVATLIFDSSVNQEKSARMSSNTRRVVWIVDATVMMTIAAVVVYGAPASMKSMINCLYHVQKINYELSIYHWPMSAEKKKRILGAAWLIATVAICVVDHVQLALSVDLNETETWISVMYSFYYYYYFILHLQQLQFVVYTMHVLYSFKAINTSLKNVLRDVMKLSPKIQIHKGLFQLEKKYNRPPNNLVRSLSALKNTNQGECLKCTPSHHEQVRRLALVYASLCEVVREIDRCYGSFLLLMLGACLLHLVVSPYYLINYLLEDDKSRNTKSILKVLLQMLWCICHAFNLIMVTEPCHSTHMEMEATREIVSSLMRCTNSIYDPLSVELELFFRHLILNEVFYSPLRVTTLNRSLVATILGSITTYLVVIIEL